MLKANGFCSVFSTSFGLNSGPSCIGINLRKFCYFSGTSPGFLQQKQEQKQALRYFLEHFSCLLLCTFLHHENYVTSEG